MFISADRDLHAEAGAGPRLLQWSFSSYSADGPRRGTELRVALAASARGLCSVGEQSMESGHELRDVEDSFRPRSDRADGAGGTRFRTQRWVSGAADRFAVFLPQAVEVAAVDGVASLGVAAGRTVPGAMLENLR